MNEKYEQCRNCAIQCILDKGKDRIIAAAKESKEENGGKIDSTIQKQLKGRISTLSQQGFDNQCPPEEIRQMREEAFEVVAPGRLKISPMGSLRSTPPGERPTSPIGFNNNRRLE